MTSTVYKIGTVSVTSASATVTGGGTGWAIALVTGGVFSSGGVAVPILSVESDTSLTLAYPWPGSSAGGQVYAISRETSEAVRAAWTADRLATIITRLSLVGIHPDGSGTLAERDALAPPLATGQFWLHAEEGVAFEFYRKTDAGYDGPFPVEGEGAPGTDGAPGSSNVVGTSTTSLAIATGSKAFTVVETTRGWGVGARLRASSAANGANFMEGVVASYAADSLTLTVDLVGGSGTFTDWTINLAGERGAAGTNGTGSGDVVGPVSSILNRIAVFADTTGKLLADGGALIADLLAKAGGTMTGALTLNADPSSAMHAATKQYVDNLAAGLDVKASCRFATTANITLSGTQTVDGVAAIVGDRGLVKNQTAPAENGIYIVAAGAWVRATDMDSWAEVPGANVWVEEGTANSDRSWACNANAGGTLGTTAITWTQFGGTGAFQGLNANLTAEAGLTGAADRLSYYTGLGTKALATFTAFGRSMIAAADAAAAKVLLAITQADVSGLGTGDSPQFAALNVGAATDTTISRGAAGFLAVEGNRIPSPAAQAAGDILYRGATEWERLAKGTASQVLAMNAGATAPEWVPAGSGSGGWTQIGGTTNTTSGSTVAITSIPSGYRRLCLRLNGVGFTASSVLSVALSSTNGASYGSTISVAPSQAGVAFLYGTVEIDAVGDTGIPKSLMGNTAIITGASAVQGGVDIATTGVIDAIRLAGGTFDAGSVTLWGTK